MQKTVLAHPGVRRDAKEAVALYARRTGKACREIGASLSQHMLNADAPEHTMLRDLVSHAFTASHVKALQPYIEQVTEELLAALATRERADLMADFAVPLTISVIFELLGIPEAERAHAQWSWTRQSEQLAASEADTLANEQAEYIKKLLEAKRAQPADDVYTGLVKAADERGQISEVQLVSMAHLMMMSGFETTMSMIGNAMVTLLGHPEQLALLRSRPKLLRGALEELVRYDSPVRASMLRYTVEDIDLGDVTIPAGEYVLVSNLTANHDAERFENPDRLDVRRNASGHLGYGYGAHLCMRASLARLESRIAIGRLITRFPHLALAVPHCELHWLPITFLRALISVPVIPGQAAPVG